MIRRANCFVGIRLSVSLTSRVGNVTTSESGSIYSAKLLTKYECMRDVWYFCSSQPIGSWLMTPCLQNRRVFSVTVEPFRCLPFRSLFETGFPIPLIKSNFSLSNSLQSTKKEWTLVLMRLHDQESQLLRRNQVVCFSNVESRKCNNK